MMHLRTETLILLPVLYVVVDSVPLIDDSTLVSEINGIKQEIKALQDIETQHYKEVKDEINLLWSELKGRDGTKNNTGKF